MTKVTKIVDCGDCYAIVAGTGKNPEVYFTHEAKCFLDGNTFREPKTDKEIEEYFLVVSYAKLKKIFEEPKLPIADPLYKWAKVKQMKMQKVIIEKGKTKTLFDIETKTAIIPGNNYRFFICKEGKTKWALVDTVAGTERSMKASSWEEAQIHAEADIKEIIGI